MPSKSDNNSLKSFLKETAVNFLKGKVQSYLEGGKGTSTELVPYLPSKGKYLSRKPKSRRRINMRANNSRTSHNMSLVSAPATMGRVVSGGMPWSFGRPSANCDYSSDTGIRIGGTCIYSTGISTSGASALKGFNGAYYETLTPSATDQRLQAFEECFMFYAFRRLSITYIPLCSTSTAGQVALGVIQDYQETAAVAAPTINQVMELCPSVLCPVWENSSMDYHHTGSKVWECYASGESADSKDQCALVAYIANGAISTSYGTLQFDYVMDFYEPAMFQTTVTVDGKITRKRVSKSCLPVTAGISASSSSSSSSSSSINCSEMASCLPPHGGKESYSMLTPDDEKSEDLVEVEIPPPPLLVRQRGVTVLPGIARKQ